MNNFFLINKNRCINILVEKYGLIYFTMPKNACTSITTHLVDALGLPKRPDFPKFIHKRAFYNFPSATDSEVRTKYKDLLRFSVIRNPWERLVSCYKDKIFYKTEENTYFVRVNPQFSRGMSFPDFVDIVINTPDRLADFHFCSQLYLLYGFDGYFPLNYIAEMGELNQHIETIKAKTGVPLDTFPHLNPSKKRSYTDYYTPDLIEKVRERFRIDIDFFGYEFGKKNESFSFGFVDAEKQKLFERPEFLTPILKEKNRELQAVMEEELKQRDSKLEQIDLKLKQKDLMLKQRDSKLRQRDLDIIEYKKAVKDSFSWKITAPLRILANKVSAKKNS